MFARVLTLFLFVALLGWSVSAQPPQTKPEKGDTKPVAAKADGPLFEVKLSDDTQMKVTLLDTSLSVVTRYGKLSVPASEIRRLEFGFRYPEGLEAKIEKAVNDLGAAEVRDREAAEKVLTDAGHYSHSQLRRAMRSDNAEVVQRATPLLKALEARLGSEKQDQRDYDIIETGEFTIKGRIETGSLKVRTKLFGETTVRLTDIRGFRNIAGAGSGELALDAAQYAKTNLTNWLETNIEVSSGQQLEITASGQIDTWPQQPGQYMVSPMGSGGGGGFGPPGGGGFPPGGGGAVRIGSPGQVIGRIGASGTPFVVGASYKGKATESGRLYLRIAPGQWGTDSSGSYKVKVATE